MLGVDTRFPLQLSHVHSNVETKGELPELIKFFRLQLSHVHSNVETLIDDETQMIRVGKLQLSHVHSNVETPSARRWLHQL